VRHDPAQWHQGEAIMAMTSKDVDDFQKQTREMLRAQQDAYVAAVKAWREAAATALEAGLHPPPAPMPAPFDTVPTPAEMAEASYAFAAKLLADQSRFMEELGKAMAAPTKKG
jgi:hypothetical protein